MKEASQVSLANRAQKIKPLLSCPSLVKRTTGQKATNQNLLPSCLQTPSKLADYPAGHLAEKRKTCSFSRVLVILTSLGLTFLLQGMANSTAMAVGARAADDPNANNLYTGGFCQTYAHVDIPSSWNDHHVCDDPSPNPDQAFLKAPPCPDGWIPAPAGGKGGMTQCALTLSALRGVWCPMEFALVGSRCEYQPQQSTNWLVGLCKSFTSDEVPPAWTDNGVCDPSLTDPDTSFIQDASNNACPQGWIKTTAQGKLQCALTVPAARGIWCPIGFELDHANCDYVPQNITDWQFPCSDQDNVKPDEKVIAGDWLSGNSTDINPAGSNSTTGGRFEQDRKSVV